jgi:hypothetical protein
LQEVVVQEVLMELVELARVVIAPLLLEKVQEGEHLPNLYLQRLTEHLIQ